MINNRRKSTVWLTTYYYTVYRERESVCNVRQASCFTTLHSIYCFLRHCMNILFKNIFNKVLIIYFSFNLSLSPLVNCHYFPPRKRKLKNKMQSKILNVQLYVDNWILNSRGSSRSKTNQLSAHTTVVYCSRLFIFTSFLRVGLSILTTELILYGGRNSHIFHSQLFINYNSY